VIVFVDNTRQGVGDEIGRRLSIAQWAFFAVAFIREGGVETLEAALRGFIARGGRLSVIFGNAFGITEATAIRRLQRLGAELRYHRSADTFHPKGYLFGSSTATTTAIIGSSNISASGLTGGAVVEAAQQLWNSPAAAPVTEAVFDELERSARSNEQPAHHQDHGAVRLPPIPPPGPEQRPVVEFSFKVNGSFSLPKSSYRRPITVPIEFNAVMRAHQLDANPVQVRGPGGEPFSGRIYVSNNNQGEYHQIVVNGSNGDALSKLPLGQQVVVQIVKSSVGVEVHIDRRP
jgi:HKD family nuclease